MYVLLLSHRVRGEEGRANLLIYVWIDYNVFAALCFVFPFKSMLELFADQVVTSGTCSGGHDGRCSCLERNRTWLQFLHLIAFLVIKE